MGAIHSALAWLDFAAVFVFGATGALAAARRGHDLVTFAFFAAAAGLGGGSLRDLLIDAPVFWVERPPYLIACLAAALAVWIFGANRSRERLLNWLDALGMAAYALVGAAKTLALGGSPVIAVTMGALTATFGGVVRDILAHEPSVLLRREIYVTAALGGASAYVLSLIWLAPLAAGIIGFLVAFGLRAGAILKGWSLPGFPGNRV